MLKAKGEGARRNWWESEMKIQFFFALIVTAVQLLPSGCTLGDRAYIPPIAGAVFTSSNEASVLKHKGVLKQISIDGESINIVNAQLESLASC